MLYNCLVGDLKTFLLARRQLVGLHNREAEEVSPMALTRMALDVADGLEYLSDLKYVHRYFNKTGLCFVDLFVP